MAKAIRRNDAVKLLGVTRRNRPYLMMSTALQATVVVVISFPAAALSPSAQPTGGVVQAGNIGINQNATTTTINQTTQQGIIQWQQYNVGSQQTVQYKVPTNSASTLNRVVGADPSQIAGKINSNGMVIIENQSGVVFLNGAQVNTNGLMVTAVGISNANYLAGKMVFDQGGNPNAKVVNSGTITMQGAGLAAFVAPHVRNSGTINAKMGNVVLAGAAAVTLDMYGDGLVSVNVTKQVSQTPDGATSLVTNDGVIRADGGTVQLTAAAADGVVQNLVSAGGRISANTVGAKTGTVSINGIGGNIEVTGQLSAQGIGAGTTGGAVAVNATGNVAVASSAQINVSGQAGGGTVAVGTTLARAQGGPSVTPAQTAKNVSIASGATIAANATDKGNGGNVTVLSTGTTTFAGSILARGGPNGGNGGFVETSGHTLTLPASAFVDTRAPLGKAGTWLLDPTNFVIATAGDATTVVTNLAGGNVTIQADNDITVSSAIDATGNAGAVNSLTFQAGRSIAINASIKLNGGAFTATANDSTDSVTPLNRGAGAGSFTMAAATAIDTTVGNGDIKISIGASAPAAGGGAFTPGTISLVDLTNGHNVTTSGDTGLTLGGNINASGWNVSFNTSGTINQSAGTISASGLGITAGDAVTLTGANAVGVLAASLTGSGKGLSFNNTATTVKVDTSGGVTGIVTNNGSVSLQTTTSGNININQNISAGTGAITLTSAGTIWQTGGSLVAKTLSGSSVGGATVTSATNNVGTLAALSASTGDVAVTNNNSLTVTGLVSSPTKVTLTTLGSNKLTINGGTVQAPTVNLVGGGGIALTSAGTVGQAAGLVDLSTAANGVTEDTTSVILGGTLQSTSNIVGGATLSGTANAVDNLGKIAVTGGNFTLVDKSQLTVKDTLTATGNVLLRDTNATSKITIGAAGSVGAGAAGLASFQTDALVITAGGSITGGTFELAPNTASTAITLGTAGYLVDYTGIGSTNVRIGAITGGSTTAAPSRLPQTSAPTRLRSTSRRRVRSRTATRSSPPARSAAVRPP